MRRGARFGTSCLLALGGLLALATSAIGSAQPGRAGAVVLGFGGDVSIPGGFHARSPFAEVTSLLSSPDATWVNLETTVGDAHRPRSWHLRFRSPVAALALLRAAGVDGVALANNHALDFGRPALARTLRLLDAEGLLHAGAGATDALAYAPRVQHVGARTVATLAFHRFDRGPAWDATDRRTGLASAHGANAARSVSAVRAARQVADVVVVMVHWGLEGQPCPERFQRELARRWASAGADLVIGSHPHVLQGIERIERTWVLYSTGNLAFPSARGEAARSAFFAFTFAGDGVPTLQARPLELVDGRPRPAPHAVARDILAELERRSFGVTLDETGGVHPGAASAGGACAR